MRINFFISIVSNCVFANLTDVESSCGEGKFKFANTVSVDKFHATVLSEFKDSVGATSADGLQLVFSRQVQVMK